MKMKRLYAPSRFLKIVFILTIVQKTKSPTFMTKTNFLT